MTSYAYINDVIPHEEVTLTAWTTLGGLDVLVDEDIACISFVQGVGCVVCRQCNRPTGADEEARVPIGLHDVAVSREVLELIGDVQGLEAQIVREARGGHGTMCLGGGGRMVSP